MFPTFRFLRYSLLLLIPALFPGTIVPSHTGAHPSSVPASKYPDAILRLTGGQQPFTPQDAESVHDLALNPLVEGRRGIRRGSALHLIVEPLGEKLLQIDTAARGLLLKSAAMHGNDIVTLPDWVQPGPGLQTGVFQVLGRLHWKGFSLQPAVAELFQGNEFSWADGVISTEVFSPWLVRLDFRRSRLSLLPYPVKDSRPRTEWDAERDLNWWFVKVKLGGVKTRLLLDSGAARSYVSEQWIRENFAGESRRRYLRSLGSGPFHELGLWRVEIPGVAPFHISCLRASAEQIPVFPRARIDGVLGFDALRNLAIDLDYRAGRLFILR